MANTFKITQLTIAVTNTEEMAVFYSKVFNVKLSEFEAMGEKFYSGNIAGIYTMLCPNAIAGVEANQNRHQFDYSIDDLEEVVEKALSASGTLKDSIQADEKQKTVTIIDPDGNTINFIQKL